MKRKVIDAILAKAGIRPVPDDDPRYQEAPSIIFPSGTPRGSATLYSEGEDSEDTEPDTDACPFCVSNDCDHHLVTLDLTFGQVAGGLLADVCGEFLVRSWESNDNATGTNEDSDAPIEVLEQCLEQLENVVGISSEWQGGPGQSSAVRHFWTDQPEQISALAKSLEERLRKY